MVSADQNLTYLMWMLIVVSLVVTWHSQQTKMEIIALQGRMMQQRKDMEPLLKTQENRKSLNEKRWNDVMNALQTFSDKIRKKDNFVDTIKTQIRQHVLKTNKNATSVARDLLPLAEDLVIAAQMKKETGAKVQKIIKDTRADIKKIVRQSLDTGDCFQYIKFILFSNSLFSL
jgi:predicted Holliday junction resolvase-like endonuclease